MPERRQHEQEVRRLLQRQLGKRAWALELPAGTGHETYVARADGWSCFVKVGASGERAAIMARLGLGPTVWAVDMLEDGMPVMVQPYLAGRAPCARELQERLEVVATAIRRMHESAELRRVLPEPPSQRYDAAGLRALADLRRRWDQQRGQVGAVARAVDDGLERIERELGQLEGAGLVASHNDICNANWILTAAGRLYLVDLEAMALDDPACDLGAMLWWYYPPEQRGRFLEVSGYAGVPGLPLRMRVRMAMHCLSILVPRAGDFGTFDPARLAARLTDFRAVLAGRENPQGYGT